MILRINKELYKIIVLCISYVLLLLGSVSGFYSIKYYGFNVFGSNNQPIPSDGGSWLTFTKIDGR